MARSQNKYADFEGLREQAVALRRAGYSLRQIRDELKVFNNDILSRRRTVSPRTLHGGRKNVGDSCRGCLAIKVLKSADLYRRIEGSWYGIVLGADSAT
ncbi:hypothetical protein [Streptomyces tendae]|uniref:hypothetical protein n=1 Tax=Streptomyces tendae TaxID=1932 RepID=UPI002490CC92|nr:hypothetical protein [Streptomyces tendae]